MSSDLPVLEPLSLAEPTDIRVDINSKKSEDGENSVAAVQCLFCEKCYAESVERDELLRHLLLAHKLVIADVKLIANFRRYLDYWRERFSEGSLTEFCSQIKTNTKLTDPEPSELYYLLCDALPEDKQIRIQLQKEKLEEILSEQQRERTDKDFYRKCLFCKQQFAGNRVELFDHMVYEHNFSVGKPDNMVYTGELLDLLDNTLHSLQCLYCEKTFKDRHVLKEHMRKKQHKRLNPKNKKYDKYYIINYLELGKNWESFQADVDDGEDWNHGDENGGADEWSEWQEPGAQTVCLFCEMISDDTDKIIQHMKETHKFDLPQIRKDLQLTFYQQVKLINYIRREIHQNICPVCQQRFDVKQVLMDHMNKAGHVSQVPAATVWDQPQYFFPTYENDTLLCGLDDSDDDSNNKPVSKLDTIVVPEDCPVKDSILLEKHIRDELL
ncbi:hypothetical protein LSH36_85g01007 [Paralvinella palmiformis]|uniref:C2H2-type domain-containing protein n=1 Tax=Paralvinella palmiformis TaxID=53620 RepID=A0AAD9K1N3_9ANNE|nr:hypothetical protein LSH36_85g01007 [Paralvinella palmiformis]